MLCCIYHTNIILMNPCENDYINTFCEAIYVVEDFDKHIKYNNRYLLLAVFLLIISVHICDFL